MDEELRQLEEKLRQLFEEICQYPADSRQGKKALNQFLTLCQGLPGLKKSTHPDYADALNRTLEKVGRKIKTFNPHPDAFIEDLVKWIKSHLKFAFIDVYNEQNKHRLKEKEAFLKLERMLEPKLSGIERLIEELQQQDRQHFGLKLKRYIEEYPNRLLRNYHPQNHPECNVQLLIQRLFLKQPPEKLAAIAREFGVNDQTLYGYWRNHREEVFSHLQEVAKIFGYQPDGES